MEGISIRSPLKQIPEVLTKLSMYAYGPISAQYFAKQKMINDIVILTRHSASTCKAVIIARAKCDCVLIQSDAATSFFAGNMVDEDNLDIEDLDSILMIILHLECYQHILLALPVS